MYIEVGGQVVWESKSEILLGVTIDNDLTFDENVEFLNKKASQKLSALTRMARIASFKKKKILLNSFIQSQYGHCVEVWMFTSRKLNDKINSIHKRALQAVYLDYSSTFAELLEKDKSITIHQRNVQLVAIEMFKAAKEIGPDIVRDLFTFNHGSRNNRTFHIPCVTTDQFGKNSIRYFGPIVWDEMLPDKFKKIVKLEKFKNDIKEWVPEKCLCLLCREYIGGVGYVTTFE